MKHIASDMQCQVDLVHLQESKIEFMANEAIRSFEEGNFLKLKVLCKRYSAGCSVRF